MSIKVFMISLGCSKNQIDSELVLSLIKESNFKVTTDQLEADIIIINTCGFIELAKQESISTILEICKLKESGNLKSVIVMGCLAERYKHDILKEIPEVNVVLGLGSNDKIVEAIENSLKGEKIEWFDDKYNLALEGDRVLTTPFYYAYIKIAEGCNNGCTYCSIPKIRGKYRSRTMESIVDEAYKLSNQGVREIILIAQDTGMYGIDIYHKKMLAELLNRLCLIDKISWIRLLYCYPEHVDNQLLNTIKNQAKILKYIDMPLQHVNSKILKKMNRFGGINYLNKHINYIRDTVPGIFIRTTFITGFPGETDEDFEQLCNFIKTTKFERLGCFTYSREEGTKAAKMDFQIDEDTKQKRLENIMTNQMWIMDNINKSLIGETLNVLVEYYDSKSNEYIGRTQYDTPDIDNKIFVRGGKTSIDLGSIIKVIIVGVKDFDLIGNIVI